MSSRLLALTFDAHDPGRLARVWAGLLERVVVDDPRGPLLPGSDTQVGLRFTPSRTEKIGPNQVHLHLTGRAMRRDARRNRDALIASARAAFAIDGLDAALDRVARDAGVSIGTLYRHFPARLDLVRAVFGGQLQVLLAAAETAARAPDAWAGFCDYVESFCQMQAPDRGSAELTGIRLPHSPCIDALQADVLALGTEVVRRSQQQGTLRGDITPEDLAFIIWSQAQIARATRDVTPTAWRRHLHLMLDAFRAERATPLTEPALTADEVYRAMVRLGRAISCADPRG